MHSEVFEATYFVEHGRIVQNSLEYSLAKQMSDWTNEVESGGEKIDLKSVTQTSATIQDKILVTVVVMYNLV